MDRLRELVARGEAELSKLLAKFGSAKFVMAGVFVVNYILYELVKYWSK
jgi:hypothetical protein